MPEAREYDLVIIGTGAGTLAHRPAPTDQRIPLLERGGRLPRERDDPDSAEALVKAEAGHAPLPPPRRGRPTRR
ncbi:hypothetical protein ACFXG6_06900 [Streptomyces roseus]|uniref:hypothetical protein n=1 Tax=Streptomyces roseus TaxID=66430 RepID=UPI0036ADCC35